MYNDYLFISLYDVISGYHSFCGRYLTYLERVSALEDIKDYLTSALRNDDIDIDIDSLNINNLPDNHPILKRLYVNGYITKKNLERELSLIKLYIVGNSKYRKSIPSHFLSVVGV